MIHFPPLLWFSEYPWIELISKKMLRDAEQLVKWWVDAIMIENNYDLPHTIKIEPHIVLQMNQLASKLRESYKDIELWICCLRNDWESWLSIANNCWFDFVRIPVFVDTIETKYGQTIIWTPEKVMEFRKKIRAEHIRIYVDVQVKHSTLINKRPIEESIVEACDKWADWVIITWNRTWDLPTIKDLEAAREVISWGQELIIWSWVSLENIDTIKSVVDTAIIWTAFKTNDWASHDVNVRWWEESIDSKKVREICLKVNVV